MLLKNEKKGIVFQVNIVSDELKSRLIHYNLYVAVFPISNFNFLYTDTWITELNEISKKRNYDKKLEFGGFYCTIK